MKIGQETRKETKMADWIPKKEQDFVDFCEKWKNGLCLDANVAKFGWEEPECLEVIRLMDIFLEARTAYQADDSTAKRLAKDEAKEEAVDAIRDFANTSIRFNKKMNDVDKFTYGIHPVDKIMTPHPIPASQPETVVENSTNHFEHKVKALNHESGDATKPEDAYGIRYAWKVGGEKPQTGADLDKTRFSRKTVITVTHTEAEKGKTIWYATCYENAKGERGSWSPIEEAFIG
jgi:hypothetical protein